MDKAMIHALLLKHGLVHFLCGGCGVSGLRCGECGWDNYEHGKYPKKWGEVKHREGCRLEKAIDSIATCVHCHQPKDSHFTAGLYCDYPPKVGGGTKKFEREVLS